MRWGVIAKIKVDIVGFIVRWCGVQGLWGCLLYPSALLLNALVAGHPLIIGRCVDCGKLQTVYHANYLHRHSRKMGVLLSTVSAAAVPFARVG